MMTDEWAMHTWLQCKICSNMFKIDEFYMTKSEAEDTKHYRICDSCRVKIIKMNRMFGR